MPDKLTLSKNNVYQRYIVLGKRLENIQPFELNSEGKIRVATGKVYCRYMIPAEDGEEPTLCNYTSALSTRGNLVTHIKSHKWLDQRVEIASVRKGTASQNEVRKLIRFYEQIMKCHDNAIQRQIHNDDNNDPSFQLKEDPDLKKPSKLPSNS